MNIKNTKIWQLLRELKEHYVLNKEYRTLKALPINHYEDFLSIKYEHMMMKNTHSSGKKMNFDNPSTFTEKQQWLKLYDQDERKCILSDKYLVREYISRVVGAEYLFDLIKINGKDRFYSVKEIDFEKLPNQFVIKCTHGSHFNIVVSDKTELTKKRIKEIKKQLSIWLKINYAFVNGLELQYSSLKPSIIIEKYMALNDDLPDYKFCCFDGEIKFAWVDTGRFANHHRTFFEPYSPTNIIPVRLTWPPLKAISVPPNYEEMIRITKKLCDKFKFVRVDLYNLNGRIYVGELTFSSGSGYECPEPIEFDSMFGGYIHINKNLRNNNYRYRSKKQNRTTSGEKDD